MQGISECVVVNGWVYQRMDLNLNRETDVLLLSGFYEKSGFGMTVKEKEIARGLGLVVEG